MQVWVLLSKLPQVSTSAGPPVETPHVKHFVASAGNNGEFAIFGGKFGKFLNFEKILQAWFEEKPYRFEMQEHCNKLTLKHEKCI